ncbi:MAG TPA: formylglycine-generating enzyme family protein [Polyangiales bacterium]|nr:formylglycine-generating enzyme family protein [Polyangiales bacterium]
MRHSLRCLAALSALACCALAATQALAGEPSFQNLKLRPPSRIRIEAARFWMGSNDDAIARAVEACLLAPPSSGRCTPELFADEQPEHEVYLSAYAIDRLEVSNQAYLRCVSAGACAPSGISESDVRLGRAEHPVAEVSWREAENYCRWVSGRLPTEAQWERAARGDSARTFPWGRVWNPKLANHGAGDGSESEQDGFRFAAPVDAFPDGHSFYGLLNMAGNVWEFVADRYGAYDAERSGVEPQGPREGSERVIRGGSWRTAPHGLRATARARIPEGERRADVGFRCAYAVAR